MKSFYNNPFIPLYKGRRALLPFYLWIIWIIIVIFSICSINTFPIFSVDKVKLENFLSPSLAGVSFTLAIFATNMKVYSKEEINIFVEKEKEGYPFFFELVSPFIFTGMIFLIVGSISLLSTYIDIGPFIPEKIKNILICLFLDFLLLGLFGLFGIIVTVVNDIYLHSDLD